MAGQLRELRCHYGRSLYRVLYRRSGNFVILLHALSKTTAKIPASDIEIANGRFADFKQRMEALPRKRPPCRRMRRALRIVHAYQIW